VLIKVDILAQTIISEEAVVRKAGGKFKMNPLFPSTVAKIKTVRSQPYYLENIN
jgi:obg-like ATPase 1